MDDLINSSQTKATSIHKSDKILRSFSGINCVLAIFGILFSILGLSVIQWKPKIPPVNSNISQGIMTIYSEFRKDKVVLGSPDEYVADLNVLSSFQAGVFYAIIGLSVIIRSLLVGANVFRWCLTFVGSIWVGVFLGPVLFALFFLMPEINITTLFIYIFLLSCGVIVLGLALSSKWKPYSVFFGEPTQDKLRDTESVVAVLLFTCLFGLLILRIAKGF